MLKFVVLNGNRQGDEISIYENFSFHGKAADFDLSRELHGAKLYIKALPDGVLSLKASAAIIHHGDHKAAELKLVPGLIFSIGEVGFAVQADEEDPPVKSAPKTNLKDPLSEIRNALKTTSDLPPVSLAKSPLEIRFVRGPLLNTKWSVLFSSLSIGSYSNLYFFIDPNIPTLEDFLFLKETQKGWVINSLLENFVKINNSFVALNQPIQNGDLVEFGSTAFYIGTL